jgi:hypothetical protein
MWECAALVHANRVPHLKTGGMKMYANVTGRDKPAVRERRIKRIFRFA